MSRIRTPRAARPSPASLRAHPGRKSVPVGFVLTEIDRRLINAFQGGFPICERPYRVAAETLGLDEATLIERIGALLNAGVLTRFGPLFNADRMGGINVLAAMSLPDAEFDSVAEFINIQPEIAHNYRREHVLNLWFVGSAETPEKVESAFLYIESMTGFPVYRFPKEREFFVELKLEA